MCHSHNNIERHRTFPSFTFNETIESNNDTISQKRNITSIKYKHEIEKSLNLLQGNNSKALVLTFSDNELIPIIQLFKRINERYANKYDYIYKLHTFRKSPHIPPQWEKITIISEYLNAGYRVLLWIDHDAYIQQDWISLDVWLDKYTNADLIIGQEGSLEWEFNTGVMIIRNSAWSRSFFQQFSIDDPFCDEYRQAQNCCWEQDCMQAAARVYMQNKSFQKIGLVKSAQFNCRHIRKGEETCLTTGWVYHYMGQPKLYNEIERDFMLNSGLHSHMFKVNV
jgi:hypothetical protein